MISTIEEIIENLDQKCYEGINQDHKNKDLLCNIGKGLALKPYKCP